MWVGLLFSIMSMSALLQQQDAEALGLSTVELQHTLEDYRTLTIQCLVAGDYLRSSRYTIETLVLHFAVDQNVNPDTYIGNWILIGVIVRIALRMGLHRDPSHWPNIRPLQAELRRRIWITIYQIDFFTSTQVGLPRIIKDSQCDARPPAHLFEHDIGIEHDEMPPSRPLTEPTSLLYMIQRHTIIRVAAEIYDTTEGAPPSSATIVTLGAKLQKAVDAIPAWLRHRPLETSVADDPGTILHRIFLDILIYKAVYLLHRRSFVKGSAGGESVKSNEQCIKAALAILEHQRKVSEETQPGGLMFGIRWKVVSTLNHEFLQATMMLCFALSRSHEENASMTHFHALHRHDEVWEALSIAKTLWEKNAERSSEARRAATAITTVLKQGSDQTSAPSVAVSDGEKLTSMLDQSANVGHSVGAPEQMQGVAAQSLFGSIDYGQNMALDPALFAIDDEMGAFGSMLDDFVGEHVEEDWDDLSKASTVPRNSNPNTIT